MEPLKIALLSDSHDHIPNLKNAVRIANRSRCSHLFHLGDIVSPLSASELKHFNGSVSAVYGNCDGDRLALNRTFHSFGGEIHPPPLRLELHHRIMVLMHEPWLLEELALSGKVDYIFHGHTHEEYFRREGQTVIINPGEIAGIMSAPTFYLIGFPEESIEKIDL